MAPITPPTTVKRNVRSALSLASVAALGAGCGALALLWHDLPFSPKPDGALWEHVKFWGSCGINSLFPSFLGHKCHVYGSYLRSLSEHGESFGLYSRLAGAAIAGAGVGAYAATRGLISSDSLIHMRGFRLHEGKEAISRARRKCAEEIARESSKERDATDFRFHPDVAFSVERFSRHLMYVGAIGSGKTQMLTPLIAQIIERQDRVMLFDIKRDFTQFFPRAIIIGATDARSYAWDIARDISNKQAARRYAEILIEDSKDPFWAAASRALLVGYLMMLIAEKGRAWGWSELRDALVTPDEELPSIMAAYNPEAMQAVEEAKGSAPSQTTKSIKMTMQAFCSPIYDLAEAWGDTPPERRLSVLDWFLNPETKNRQIILQGDESAGELTRGYISAMFDVACSRIDKLPEARNVPPRTDGRSDAIWLFCDELPKLGKIASFDAAITLGRSKNLRWVAGLQSIEQLNEIYSKETAGSWVGNMGTVVLSRVAPGQTATHVRDMVGKREVERPNWSTSSGAGGQNWTYMTSRDEMYVIYESELSTRLGPQTVPDGGAWRRIWEAICPFASKKKKTVIRALVLGLDDALLLDWPITKLKPKRRSYVEAEWMSRRPKPRATAPAAVFVPEGQDPEEERGPTFTDEELALAEELGGPTQEEFERMVQTLQASAQAKGVALEPNPFDSMEPRSPFADGVRARSAAPAHDDGAGEGAAWAGLGLGELGLGAADGEEDIFSVAAASRPGESGDRLNAGGDGVAYGVGRREAVRGGREPIEHEGAGEGAGRGGSEKQGGAAVSRATNELADATGSAAPLGAVAASAASGASGAAGFGGLGALRQELPEYSGLYGGEPTQERLLRELEREKQRRAVGLRIRELSSGLARERREATMGLSDSPSRRKDANTDRINAFSFDERLRPRSPEPEETVAEAAHGIHEVGETVGHEAHLSETQTEHLTQGLMALEVIDSLRGEATQTPPAGAAAASANAKVLGRRR